MAFAVLLIISHFGKVLLLFIVCATSDSEDFSRFFHFSSTTKTDRKMYRVAMDWIFKSPLQII